MEINPEMIQMLEPEVMDFKPAMLRIEGKIWRIMIINLQNLSIVFIQLKFLGLF